VGEDLKTQYSKMYPKQCHRLTYRFHLPQLGQVLVQ
jgi:hypothetical protein